MKLPWHNVDPVSAEVFRDIRLQTIFECCKWDPQVEDVGTLSPQPIVLTEAAWAELARLAERLADELVRMELEILEQPRLLKELALPWRLRRRLDCRELREAAAGPRHLRLVRFDFHFTADGWRISEANCDVPGGFNEASGFTRLMAQRVGNVRTPGDPTAAVVSEMAARTGAGGTVALVHATAFSDDRQVMVYLARRLERAGLKPMLAAPDHLRWRGGHPTLETDWHQGAVDFVFRFFPGEWLHQLPQRCAWWEMLGYSKAGLCSPATSLITQSKRLPLVWDRLSSGSAPTWRSLLPATCDPRNAQRLPGRDIVLKPALGRVGDLVRIAGVTPAKEAKLIERAARRHPDHWIAQERFAAIPYLGVRGPVYPCIGVYTLNGRVIGAYGRVAQTPLINHLAQDAAVLIAAEASSEQENRYELNRTLQGVGA